MNILKLTLVKKKKTQDEIVTSFLNEITKDVLVNDQKLVKAGADSFLFSFYSIENSEGTQFKNHIWYRICVKDSKILIVSFVFSYKLKTKKKRLYPESLFSNFMILMDFQLT